MILTTWPAACPGCGSVTAHRVTDGEAVCRACGRRFAGATIATAAATRARRDGLDEATDGAPAPGRVGDCWGSVGGWPPAAEPPRREDAGEPSPLTQPPASIRLHEGAV